MTLLALELIVPSIGDHPSDRVLREALAHNGNSYLAFLLSFYLVASYWGRHRVLMRSVNATEPALIRDTLLLLVLVAAMPFPSSLIGRYGSVPIALAVYGSINALASLVLMLLSRDVRRMNVRAERTHDFSHDLVSWWTLGVFLLSIPAGYVLGHHGPWVLVLLAVPRLLTPARRFHRSRHAA